MDFGLQPRVLGIVRVLAGRVRDARSTRRATPGRDRGCRRGAVRAGQEHEVVGTEQRGARRRVRGESFFENAQAPLQIAHLDERAADERCRPMHFLRDPVGVTDDGELLVGALDVARRPAGQVDEDLEEQRKGQRLRVIEGARVGDSGAHQGEPQVGKPAQRLSSAPARSGRRFPARSPSATRGPRGTPGRTASRALLEMLVSPTRARRGGRAPRRPTTRRSSAGADRRGARRAPCISSEMSCAMPDLARDDVVGRHADEDRDDARRVLDLAAELAGTLVGAADVGDRVTFAGLDRQARRSSADPSSAAARPGLGGSLAQERQARAARAAPISSCA